MNLQAVEMFGKKWTLVAGHVPQKDDGQVRERWVNVLNPTLKKKQGWTAEEDTILKRALDECKHANGSPRYLKKHFAMCQALKILLVPHEKLLSDFCEICPYCPSLSPEISLKSMQPDLILAAGVI